MSSVREQLQLYMKLTAGDEALNHTWTYEAVRPMPVPASWRAGQRVIGDCSKGYQYLCRWAGGPDPMLSSNGGAQWGAYGNSSTIWAAWRHIPQSEVEIGDAVTFGFSSGEHHAAMIYELGPDPRIWNFGGQGQPIIDNLSDEVRFHRGMTVTFCKLPVVDPPPTPQDKLRAMTGFYSWVAWRLGEGPWKKYGPRNKSVRPNVPGVIPVSWWSRLVRFLAARKKGNAATR